MNKPTTTKSDATRRPCIKTDWLTLSPNIGIDTIKGKRTNSGTMAFGMHAGTATIDGKEINITHSGCGLVFSYNGRECHLNVKHALSEAVKLGLLEKTIDFK